MIVKHLNRFFCMLLICSGCSAQNENLSTECIKANIESETVYNGYEDVIVQNMKEFNVSNNSLDIIRVITDSGFDTQEKFKRLVINNDKLYIIENGNQRELSKEKLHKLNTVFSKHLDLKSIITCKQNSSRNFTYRYFVRINNQLVMTFSANKLPNTIDKDLIADELEFISLFEDLN